MTTEQELAIDRAIVQGKLIDATRLYRQATGVPLGPARAYVDERKRSLLLLAPNLASRPSDLPDHPDADRSPAEFSVIRGSGSLVSILSLGFVAFGSLYLAVTLAR